MNMDRFIVKYHGLDSRYRILNLEKNRKMILHIHIYLYMHKEPADIGSLWG